ncbi:hypothetical protein IJ556_07545 [bacterium]|nr:hypothetical protein [bacterium]
MAKKQYSDEELRSRANERQREYAKRTGYEANAKYNKTKTKLYAFRVTIANDGDIVEWLDSKESVSKYLKDLIRKDIQNN